MVGSLTNNEEAQLIQTVEMFEVITQSQPQDYQSLEILKEAYVKLGRDKDAVSTSKRIAQAYVLMGQLSSAILEYESILQRFPDDADVLAALSEIESKANSLNAQPAAADIPVAEAPKVSAHAAKSKTSGPRPVPTDIDDGRQDFEIDVDIVERILGDVAAFRDDDGQRFADVADLVPGERHLRTCVEDNSSYRRRQHQQRSGLPVGAEIVGGIDRYHAGPVQCPGYVDIFDAGMRHLTAKEGNVQHAG